MIVPKNVLLVGLGSPFGDDQFGWRVVEAVERTNPAGLTIKRARSASEILDWLDSIDRLIICDACHGSGPVDTIRRWRWPAAEIPPTCYGGSHDLDLSTVLSLAERLGKLPREVILWVMEGRSVALAESEPDLPLSPEVESIVSRIAALIQDELSQTRSAD